MIYQKIWLYIESSLITSNSPRKEKDALFFFEKKSFILNPRNPLKKDETIIDYEMDSEEEWNEQNGEDVAAENKMDEDEDDEVEKLLREEEEEEEAAGFIVPDDYLSASEFGLS